MFNVLTILFCNIFLGQNTYIFPNKNASIEWNNNEKYDINLSIVDSEWNHIYNSRVVSNQETPFIWNVPNFINNYTFYNKNLLFIQNNSVIDVKNLNNYGVIISKNNHNYNLKSNYECNYFNLSLNNTNNFTLFNNILILNDTFFGIYDITITSDDRNLFVFDTINVTQEDEDSEWSLVIIIMLFLLGLCGLAILYLLFFLLVYGINRVFGINLFSICRRRKKINKNRIHPNFKTQSYNNKNLRRRYSTSDTPRLNNYRPNYNLRNNYLENYNYQYRNNFIENQSFQPNNYDYINSRNNNTTYEHNNHIQNYHYSSDERHDSPTDSVNNVFI